MKTFLKWTALRHSFMNATKTSLLLSMWFSSLVFSNVAISDDVFKKANLRIGTKAPITQKSMEAKRKKEKQLLTLSEDMSQALDISSIRLITSSIGESSVDGISIYKNALGKNFPSKGDSFVILSTGLASSADLANDSDSLSATLDGLNNSQGNDMIQYTLELDPPSNAVCVSFDFAFYSEEFPEFVGSSFNDTFTAEIGESTFTIVGNTVEAINNFAFDIEGNIISVNTAFTIEGSTETTYDGGTSILTATTPIDSSDAVQIVFTIMDLGDSIYDSAVFIDNLFFSTDPSCDSGSKQDTDGDGLLDIWETSGYISSNGEVVDLPAMGADPLKKDLFIEVDYMANENGQSFKPSTAALKLVIDAFANAPVDNPDGTTGITLHIDAGALSVAGSPFLNTSLSESNEVSYQSAIETWSGVEELKETSFESKRAPIFRYALYADQYKTESGISKSSGIAKGIPGSDFLVTLGILSNVTSIVEAGTFMHELGHTLGLRHGGNDDEHYKPNYLSVMNYAFQLTGVKTSSSKIIDFSFEKLTALDEDDLDETKGLIVENADLLAGYGSRFWCDGPDSEVGTDKERQVEIDSINTAVDWNCNNDATEVGIEEDINKDTGLLDKTNLEGFDDWKNIAFKGGSVGSPGIIDDNEIDPEDPAIAEMDDETAQSIRSNYAVDVILPGGTNFNSDGGFTQKIIIQNIGMLDDIYTLSAVSLSGWIDPTEIPLNISVEAGGEVEILISGKKPSDVNATEELSVTAQSQNLPSYLDVQKIFYNAAGGFGSRGTHTVEAAVAPEVSEPVTSEPVTSESNEGGGGLFWLLSLLIIGMSVRKKAIVS